jgi:tripartite-type tricarboxylate transporter receptor subunit TctC
MKTLSRDRRWLASAGLSIGLVACAVTPAAAADSVEEFYHGKTIDLIVGYSAGGLYDLYGRLVAQFMGNHIPGHPTIVPRNMPGGSSRVAAGYIANVAPKDGTALAVGSQSLALEQALGRKAQFDMAKMNYIGNPNADINVIVTWHTSGVKTLEDAMKREVTVGSTGDDPSSQYPKATNALLGTRFKIVTGYPGGNDIDLAMERGEVEGRGSSSWGSWKSSRASWLKEKKINVLVQIGLKKTRDLPDVPLLLDVAKNDQDRAVLRLLSSQTTIGKQIFAGPGVPAERVKALRAAFDATMKDPAFLAQAKKQSFDIDPVSGEDLQKIVDEMLASPKAVTDRLNEILGRKKS